MEVKFAEDISRFYAMSIGIGVSKNENGDHQKSKFMVIKYMSDRGGDPATDMLWQDDYGAQIDQLLNDWQICKPDPDHADGYIVDMERLDEKVEGLKSMRQKVVWNNLLTATGGTMEWYKFKKGPCYANQADGTPTKYKDGTRVQAEGIFVFAQIDRQEADEEGKVKTYWKKGKSPQEKGENIERRLWRTPVDGAQQTVTTTAQAVAMAEQAPAQPTAQGAPAVQPNPAQPNQPLF
jgi:hypothetical protein